jgi:CMP-N,N'-diacetyllegionaminic acid synthase
MIGKKKVIAIIPARAGSKGLPGKNIRPMCGKPLIAWSIEKAKLSKYLDMVLVTTDCEKTASIAKQFGAYVPFLRPDELAMDQSSTYDAISHALDYLYKEEGQSFDYVVLLEPTSPLREDSDIDRMLEKLIVMSDEFDSIVSIGEVDEHPSIIRRVKGAKLESFCSDLRQTERRQDNEPAYFPYGVAYIAKTEALLDQNTFYTYRCTHFIIKSYQTYEIDSIYGFLCVENIMRYEWQLA